MTTYSGIMGILHTEFSENQFVIQSQAGGVFVAPTGDGEGVCDNENFHVLENGLQLKGNADADSPPSGFIGERLQSYVPQGSAVSCSTNTATNVTSLNLSPGIWELSSMCCLNGSLTGSAFASAISETSATMGTNGLNQSSTSALPTSSIDSTLTVPSVRIETDEAKTVYLVARATYLLGSASAYGRLSAVRVA